MGFDPNRHHRRSIRLKGHDYGQPGAYFVTVCAQDRACLFGEVIDGQMRLNELGQIVRAAWNGLTEHYAGVRTDAFVVMPNHAHGIVVFGDLVEAPVDSAGAGSEDTGPNANPVERVERVAEGVVDDGVGAGFKPAPTGRHGLSEIVRGFKTFSSRRINALRNTPGVTVWQRNYYEHVIRDEASLHRIRQYILGNPTQWAFDRENPDRRTFPVCSITP